MTIILNDKRQEFRVSIPVVYKYRQINAIELERLKQQLKVFDNFVHVCDEMLFATEERTEMLNLSLGGVVFYAAEKMAVKTICLLELHPEGYSEKIYVLCSVMDCEVDSVRKDAVELLYRIRGKFEYFIAQNDKILDSILKKEIR